MRMLLWLSVFSLLVACGGEAGSASAPEGTEEPAEHESTEPAEIEPEESEPEGAADAPPVAAPIAQDTLLALEALGYAEATPTDNPEERGVRVHEPAAFPGVNLFSSRDRANAILIDMDGRELHRWSAGSDQPAGRSWMHVEPSRDGSLYAITKDQSIALYAWDSSVIWRTRIRAHHDLTVLPNGELLVLIRGRETFEVGAESVPILADSIARLSAAGEVQSIQPLGELLAERYSRWRLSRVVAQRAAGASDAELLRTGGLADMLHTNSIETLSVDLPGVAPAGSVLLSCRAISRVVILDAALERVLYVWGAGELEGQHDATQLPNGNLLLFDNGNRRSSSRAIELDPRSGEIVWSYAPEGLYSMLRSGAQRLPNDHILITESDSGHALEVSRAGEVVWEFWNPDVRGAGADTQRAVIYRLNRYPADFFEPLP